MPFNFFIRIPANAESNAGESRVVQVLSDPLETAHMSTVRSNPSTWTSHTRRLKVGCARCCNCIFSSKVVYFFPIILFFGGICTIILTFIYKPLQGNQNGVKLIVIGGLCICMSLFSFSFIVSFSFVCPHIFNDVMISENMISNPAYSIRNNEASHIASADQILNLYASQIRSHTTPYADDPPLYDDALKLVVPPQ